MKQSILYECLAIAKKKVPNHKYIGRKYHYSFIIADNSILEYSPNTNHVVPKHFGYEARIGGNEAFCHSEIAAYQKAKGLLLGRKFEIVNIRLNKSGEIRLSKPCSVCFTVLRGLGCKKFYFSSEIGFLKC